MSEKTHSQQAGDPGPEKEMPQQGDHPRGKWAHKMEFLCSMAGQIINCSSFWRFPYMFYVHGGVVFLIPYCMMLFFVGVPLFVLETSLGQYTGEGTLTSWKKICPMFQGLGFATQILAMYLNIYLVVISAWTLLYFFMCFKSVLPWSTCDNSWNTADCQVSFSLYANPHLYKPNNSWSFLSNVTSLEYDESLMDFNYTMPLSESSSEKEFWNNYVLNSADSFSLTHVNSMTALCLLAVWIVCYFCVFKGVKYMGKVVYFTATFPYLALFMLFIRGVTLPGAGVGLLYCFWPDFEKLLSIRLWHDALCQVIFTYSMSVGVLTSLGSYNKYKYNYYRDCLVLCGLEIGTSIFACFVVFSVVGFIAHDQNLPVEEFMTGGPILAFLTFTRALSMLPGSSFWCMHFFFMILILGLDNQFLRVDSVATAISDMFPNQLRRPYRRELLVLGIAVVCFLLGLPFLTKGGIVLFHLVDNYGVSEISCLFIACAECIVIGWLYGADRFYDNIEDMLGYRPFPVLKYCWMFIIPALCWITVMYDQFHRHFPHVGVWASIVGCFLLIIPLMCIPIFILVSTYKNLNGTMTPSSELRQIRPHKPRLTLCKRVVLNAQAPLHKTPEENDKMMMEEHGNV
ncbi:uncharacterized protein V6R79_023982 [Siganus canaliculatus]